MRNISGFANSILVSSEFLDMCILSISLSTEVAEKSTVISMFTDRRCISDVLLSIHLNLCFDRCHFI